MRIPISNHFNMRYVAIFIAIMFVGQEAEGTSVVFALLTAVYIALWALAYNVAGGLAYPSGAYVLGSGLFSVVVGFAAKILFFEPGQRNLLAPNTTMLAYCAGMLGILIASVVTRFLRPRHGLLKGFDSLETMHRASILCLFVGAVFVAIAGSGASAGSGSVLSALSQVNRFPSMAILLSTTYVIQSTHGRRSVNWVVAVGIAIFFGAGLITFGKEGMLAGFVTWGIAATLQGYDYKKFQVLGLTLGFAFITYYLVPYSQYARVFAIHTGGVLQNLPVMFEYLGDLPRTRQLYLATLEGVDIAEDSHLYDQREGFLDRLIIVAPDDALIDFTAKGNIFGISPTISAFSNIIPHFIWPSKPAVNTGNVYAREMGGNSDDTTTGITFSATADAFHEESWLGVLLLMPIVLSFSFVVQDSIAGSAEFAPWALLPIVGMSQISGGGLGGAVYQATFGMVGLLFVYWTTKVAGPLVLNVVKSRNSTRTPPSFDRPGRPVMAPSGPVPPGSAL